MCDGSIEPELFSLRRRLEDAITLARLSSASCRALSASTRRRLELTRLALTEAQEVAVRANRALTGVRKRDSVLEK